MAKNCHIGVDNNSITPIPLSDNDCCGTTSIHTGIKEESAVAADSDSKAEGVLLVTFMHLPVEDVVFKSIFSKLNLKALFNLGNTCLMLRNMVLQYFQMLKVIDVGIFGSKISERALIRLLSDNDRCCKLILRNCKSSLTDHVLEPMLERNPHLTLVDLSNCTSLSNHSLQTLSTNCSLLTCVTLAGCVWATSEAVTNLGICCTGLTQLDLSGCWNIDDDCITTISSACSR